MTSIIARSSSLASVIRRGDERAGRRSACAWDSWHVVDARACARDAGHVSCVMCGTGCAAGMQVRSGNSRKVETRRVEKERIQVGSFAFLNVFELMKDDDEMDMMMEDEMMSDVGLFLISGFLSHSMRRESAGLSRDLVRTKPHDPKWDRPIGR